MNTFVIASDNNITVFGPNEELPKAEDTPEFKSREELGRLAESWPAERLVQIWNTLAGARPVKRFTNRNTAVGRLERPSKPETSRCARRGPRCGRGSQRGEEGQPAEEGHASRESG
jgi:hypothetical protein